MSIMKFKGNLRDAILASAFFAGSFALAAPPARAESDGRLRVEVLVDGRPVREYHARETTYVEAYWGHELSLRVTNLEPARVAVALAVDGRNTIDARRTSARDARKWILEPWQSIVVDGWQVDEGNARRFFFTTEDRSYSGWLGDTSNAGVIEAVSFREIDREPIARLGRLEARAEPDWAATRLGGKLERLEFRADPNWAATGIGREVKHDVVCEDFDYDRNPSGRVRIRYEYRDELVALGALPEERPYSRRESARGFTDSWCPEPPRGW